MTELDPQTTKVWISLLSASRALLDSIEAELKKKELPRLSWYDALLEIEKAGDEGIRPYELKDRLLLPQYGTSRLLDRIAKAGLITREGAENDGRGQIIRLTQSGRETRKAMWPIYASILVGSIESKLSKSEAIQLEQLLNRLSDSDV